jgi:hypothetical protein
LTIASIISIRGFANMLMIWVTIAVVLAVLFTALKQNKPDRRRMLACLILVFHAFS